MRKLRTAAGILAMAVAPVAAHACLGVGVIVRIQGRPQDVVIMRSGVPVARPRVLEVLCEGDSIRADNGAVITLSLDGSPIFKVSGGAPYSVGARRGAPSLAGNAYRNVSDNVLPDMKRQPWDVRLRGPGRELSFAVSNLTLGQQTLTAGARDLLVRADGGVGAYRVQLLREGATVADASGATNNIVLSHATLTPGAYILRLSDSSGKTIEGKVTVVADKAPLSSDYSGMTDPEVAAAAAAADLARAHSDTWTMEAEQMLQSSPVNGLDRDSVYELIESYGPA